MHLVHAHEPFGFLKREGLEQHAVHRVVLAASRSLIEDCRILGLFEKPQQTTSGGDDVLTNKLLDLLVSMRSNAKNEKNFALADSIRDALSGLSVTLEDSTEGTRWRIG